MNRWKLLGSVGVVVFISIPFVSLSQNADSIKCWSSKDKLSWSDFKGEIPHDEKSSQLHAVCAHSFTPIPFRNNNKKLGYRIKLVFLRYESWKREDTATVDGTGNLLAHEQLHFDIAELYARKARRAIEGVSRTNPNPAREDFVPLIYKLLRESSDIQDNYDGETLHGMIIEAEMEWRKKIPLELKRLEAYASYRDDCQ